jgi:hypothetical protein
MAGGAVALTTLNQALELSTVDCEGGFIGVQYGAFGADGVTAASGTIVAEVSINGVEWYAKNFIPPGGGAGTATLAAPGIAYVKPEGASRVRFRMSVVGGGQGVQVFANTQAT